jgi:hypothetical protein
MTVWTITADFFAKGDPAEKSAVGVCGPRGCTLTAKAIRTHPDGVKVRILDDDGEVNYHAVVVGHDLLAPLDDFAAPNLGSTTVEVREDGKWASVN